MKRLVVLLLTLALLISFAGCAEPTSADKGNNPTSSAASVPPVKDPKGTDKPTSVNEDTATVTSAPTAKLTADQAKAIALNHAGLTAEAVRRVDVELDKDNGILHYDVDFDHAGYEYDYEIHAQTGKVLKVEKELDN